MYGKVEGKMTEATPYNPCSRKGEVRAVIVTNLENEIKNKNINAIIARSADLYGPYATKTSVPYILVFDKLLHGKKAQWMIDPTDCTHSLTPSMLPKEWFCLQVMMNALIRNGTFRPVTAN